MDSEVNVASKTFKLKTWYRVNVHYNFKNVKLTIQDNEIREHKVFMNVKKVIGLHRGTIGFATKGK